MTRLRFAGFWIALMSASPVCAQVAPIPYWTGTPFGFGGAIAGGAEQQTAFFGTVDDDGFRSGLSFSSYSVPVSAFSSGFGLRLNAFGSSGYAADGAQYGYSFKGLGDLPVTLFGGVNSLRTTPDVFTSLVNPGFDTGRTLATAVTAGIEFKPTSNLSLSLSANVVQPAATLDTDLRTQMLRGR